MKISSQYVDGEYADKNPSFHVEDSPWKAAQIYKAIQRSELTPARIAEVGCGAGEILVQLEKKLPAAKFVGYELSPQAYELCQTRQSDRIRYYRKDLLQEPERFDLVLCIDVFEHVEDYLGFLRMLSDKADHFIFHIPLDMNVQMVARSAPILGVRAGVGHLHYFSKDTALATLRDCGFEIVDYFYTPNAVDRPKSSKAKLLQLPRKLAQRFSVDMTARFLGGYSLMVTARKQQAA